MIMKEYVLKHSRFSLEVFDLAIEEEIFRLKDFFSQQSMFESVKMAVLNDSFDSDKKILGEILKNYKEAEEITILISENDEPDKELNFLLEEPVLSEEFAVLKGDKWHLFVRKEMKHLGLSIDNKAVDFLCDFFNGDAWGISMELEKLSVLGNSRVLTVEDIKKAGDYFISENIFNFINAVLFNGDLKLRIGYLEKIFSNKEEPARIFNIMAGQRRLSDKLLSKMADYDVMIKSGKIDYEEALLELAIGD